MAFVADLHASLERIHPFREGQVSLGVGTDGRSGAWMSLSRVWPPAEEMVHEYNAGQLSERRLDKRAGARVRPLRARPRRTALARP